MNVPLGISSHTLSVGFSKEIGRVIPTFSVLSTTVVPLILVLYVVPELYIFRFSISQPYAA
jgi:hypothetical protein